MTITAAAEQAFLSSAFAAAGDDVFGFDYRVWDLSLSLSAGTYYLGINSDVYGVTLMGNTQYPAQPDGLFQSISDGTVPPTIRWESKPGETPFRVYGTPIPEPTSLALVGLGAVGLVAWRRRRRG